MSLKLNSLALFIVLILCSCGSSFNLGSVDEFKKQKFNLTKSQIKDSLSLALTKIAKRNECMAIGVALLNKDSVFYQNSFGKRSVESGEDFSLQTVMPIGSISKTIASVSIMKAVELGFLNLDDDINQYLSFKLRNPHHPNTKITVRQICTHTSSLRYTEHYDHAYIFDSPIPPIYEGLSKKHKKHAKAEIDLYNNNVKVSMTEFIKSIYTEEGKYYKKKNFLKVAPGAKYSYCNENAGLAALVIEGATKKNYKTFVNEYIVLPTGMAQSGWSMTDYSEEEKGQLYMYKKAIPNYNLITYPDGGFVTNITDFTKYFQALIQGYYGADNILNAASYKVLFQAHHREGDKATGLFMDLAGSQIGHNGGDPGITTFAYFDKETSYGYILFFKYGVTLSLIDSLREVRKYSAYLSVLDE